MPVWVQKDITGEATEKTNGEIFCPRNHNNDTKSEEVWPSGTKRRKRTSPSRKCCYNEKM